jgi:hypothetical protein
MNAPAALKETHEERRLRCIAQETASDLESCLTETQRALYQELRQYYRFHVYDNRARWIENDTGPAHTRNERYEVHALRSFIELLTGTRYVRSSSDLAVPTERWLSSHYEYNKEATRAVRDILNRSERSGMRDGETIGQIVANLVGVEDLGELTEVTCHGCGGSGEAGRSLCCTRCSGRGCLYYAHWKNACYPLEELHELGGHPNANWPPRAGHLLDFTYPPVTDYTYNYQSALTLDFQYHSFSVGDSNDASGDKDFLVVFFNVGRDAREGFTEPRVFEADCPDDQAIYAISDLTMYCTSPTCDFYADSRDGGQSWESERDGDTLRFDRHRFDNLEEEVSTDGCYFMADDEGCILCPRCHEGRIAVGVSPSGSGGSARLAKEPRTEAEIIAHVDQYVPPQGQ